MIYTYKEVIKLYKSDYQLKKAIEDKKIYKIEKGLYSDKSFVNELAIICKKYPNAVITMDSAFYYYGLTDVIPQKIYLNSARDTSKIKNKTVVQTFLNINIIDKGKIALNTEDGIINIYNKERLLVELIRKKNQIPFDYYKEIISNYREIKDELDMYNIEEYACLFRNSNSLFETLQREVF